MAEDYGTAAVRHYRDAELLEAHQRGSNADHLFGIAAECAIKSALVSLPAFAKSGQLHKTYHKHIDKLWDAVPTQTLYRRHQALFTAMKQQSPFTDWSADQRYAGNGAITRHSIENHRRAAKRILGSVGLLGTRAGAL
jgi:hypothetical protein